MFAAAVADTGVAGKHNCITTDIVHPFFTADSDVQRGFRDVVAVVAVWFAGTKLAVRWVDLADTDRTDFVVSDEATIGGELVNAAPR